MRKSRFVAKDFVISDYLNLTLDDVVASSAKNKKRRCYPHEVLMMAILACIGTLVMQLLQKLLI